MNGIDAHATACHLQQQDRFPVHLVLFDTRNPSDEGQPIMPEGRREKADDSIAWQQWLRPIRNLFRRSIPSRRIDTHNDTDTLSRLGAEAVRQGILATDCYLRLYHDVAAAGVDAAAHYLSEGWKEGRLPSPWFHADTYAILEPRFREEESDPVRHFLAYGIRRDATRRGIQGMATAWPALSTGNVPNRVFDSSWYLRRYPGVANSWLAPLPYYIVHGDRELCFEPSLHFNRHAYAAICPDFDRHRHNPVLHYLLKGRYDPVIEKAVGELKATPAEAERLVASGWFDPDWYTTGYPGTPFLGAHPLDHYMALGWRYGRKPFADYDADAFSERFPDFLPGRMNPLRHLLQQENMPERNTLPWPLAREVSPGRDHERDESSRTTSRNTSSIPITAVVPESGVATHRQELEKHVETVVWQGIQNRRAYRPGRYDGTMHILSNQYHYDEDPTLGWKDELYGEICTYRLFGDHESYHRDELPANTEIIHGVLTGIFGQAPTPDTT